MDHPDQTTSHIRVADMNDRTGRSFTLSPNQDALAALAKDLDLLALKKLRFTGELRPDGRRGWKLTGQIGATVVQSCVVSLDPVTTRIEEQVLRRYTPDMDALQARSEPESDGEGAQIPQDDSIEPLPAVIDLTDVMSEALALSLPLYPRAEGVELGEAVYAEIGTTPLRDEDVKPFAGLAGLRAKLAEQDVDDGDS